jgi:hypothetical protein
MGNGEPDLGNERQRADRGRVWVVRAALALTLAPGVASAQAYDDPEVERMLCKLDGTCPKSTEPPATPETPAVPEAEAPPIVPVRPRGIALARNALVVTLTMEASVGRGTLFEPTSIAPDVSYGLTDRLTLTLAHSGFATTGFRGSAGGGVCLTGEARGCARAYNNAGIDAVVDVVRGRVAVAAVAGIHAVSFDPLFVNLKVGAQAAYVHGRVTATLAPSIFVGVTERDRGNEGTVFAPASVGVDVSKQWFVAVGGGIATPIADAGDGWTVRLGAIARYRIQRGLFVSGSVFLPKLVGGDAVTGTGADARVANLWFTYAR